MATPKLQTTKAQRAAEIPAENILPMLPDGRTVIIGKGEFHLVTVDKCSCRDLRMQKADAPKEPCKHMIRLGAKELS